MWIIQEKLFQKVLIRALSHRIFYTFRISRFVEFSNRIKDYSNERVMHWLAVLDFLLQKNHSKSKLLQLAGNIIRVHFSLSVWTDLKYCWVFGECKVHINLIDVVAKLIGVYKLGYNLFILYHKGLNSCYFRFRTVIKYQTKTVDLTCF